MNSRWISLGLSLFGVGGVGLTSYLAIKGHEESKDKTDKKEKLLAYKWAILSGVGTSACILGSHHVSSKEIAALTASCTYLAANRDKIEKKIKEKFGEEKLHEIKTDIGVDTVKEKKSKEIATTDTKKMLPRKSSVEWTGNGPLKCFEGYSGRYFYSTLEKVKEAEMKLNNRLHDGEYVCLNDFYELLGMAKTHFGNTFGWPASEDYYDIHLDEPITFENTIVEDDFTGEPVLIIDVYTYPIEGWEEV